MFPLLLLVLLITSAHVLGISSPLFGLKSPNGESLKLTELRMKSLVKGPYQELQYICTYKNPKDHPLEAIFSFPRRGDFIFHKFEATFQDKILLGKITDVEPGSSSKLIHLTVGKLEANQTVKILLSIIKPLKLVLNNFYELKFPAITNQDFDLKSLQIDIQIHSNSPFSILSNPTHQFKPNLSEPNEAVWNVTISTDQDFIVYFAPERLLKGEIFPIIHPDNLKDHGFFLNIVPDLNYPSHHFMQETLENRSHNGLEILHKDALAFELERPSKSQFLFLIDQSDSMKGALFETLKKTLTALIQTLPKYSLFRFIGFGSTISQLQDRRKKDALELIPTLQADMGSRNLLKALEHVKSFKYAGYTVIVLTDGKIANSEEIIDLVSSSERTYLRFCGLEIVNKAPKKIFQHSEFVAENEDFGEKAFQFMHQSVFKQKLNWNVDFRCKDFQDRVLFNKTFAKSASSSDQAFHQWIDLEDSPDLNVCELRFAYQSPDRSISDYKLQTFRYKTLKTTDFYHKIAYHNEIQRLEQSFKRNTLEEDARKFIVDQSKRYQVLSDYTSLVLQNN